MALTREDFQAIADALAPGDLLQFITYTPDPTDSDDAADPSSAVLQRFVHDAAADACYSSDQAVEGTRQTALAGDIESPGDVATIQHEGRALDIALVSDDLLEDLVDLYALGGWSAVRAAADQLHARAYTELAGARAKLAEAGRPDQPQRSADSPNSDRSGYPTDAGYPAGPRRSTGSPTSDRSGTPLTEGEVSSAQSTIDRWKGVQGAVDAALSVLAGSIADSLEALENKVHEQALLRANAARERAAVALARYQPVRFAKGVNDMPPTPTIIWGYRFGDGDTADSDEGKQVAAAVTGLHAFVGPLYARVQQVRDAQRTVSSMNVHEGDETQVLAAQQELAITQPMLAKELTQVARSQHPWAVPVALSVTGLSDEKLAGCLYHILHDIIDVTEAFALPKASLVASLRTDAVWLQVLRDGPEQVLLDRLPDDSGSFQPLASQPLIAASVAEFERSQDAFAAVTSLYYQRSLAELTNRKQIMTAAAQLFGLIFDIALMAIPGGALPTVFEGAIAAHSAISGIRALLTRDAEFRAALTGTVIDSDGLDWLVDLGTVLAGRPADPGLLEALLAAGVQLSSITAFVTRINPAKLQWLDHIMTIGSLIP